MFTIHDNIREFERGLTDFAKKQLPFAVSQSLNDTGGDVKEAWEAHLKRRLDRPTPFTQRGVFLSRASKRKLTAIVGIKDIQARYLERQQTGGTRFPKGKAILVPVSQRLNKYGNLPKGAIARILARGDTFIASRGDPKTKHLRPGIYKRPKRSKLRRGGVGNKNVGTQVGPELLVAFEDKARYRKRIDLDGVGKAKATAVFPRHFARRFKNAIATAK